MAVKSAARDSPDDLFASLVDLSQQLVAAQQSGAPAGPLIAASVPLFARLRALFRDNSVDSRQRKETALEARKEVDAANLALQNLQYEQAHLEREIRACQSYDAEYGNVPLVSEAEHAAAIAPDAAPSDPHELMIARLTHELAERKRLEAERKDLQLRKAKIGKANDEKRAKLDDLEAQLQAFLESAKSIQTNLAKFS